MALERRPIWPEGFARFDTEGAIYRELPGHSEFVRWVDVCDKQLGGDPERVKCYIRGEAGFPNFGIGAHLKFIHEQRGLDEGLTGKIGIHLSDMHKFVQLVRAYRSGYGAFLGPIQQITVPGNKRFRVARQASQEEVEASRTYLGSAGFDAVRLGQSSVDFVRQLEGLDEVLPIN